MRIRKVRLQLPVCVMPHTHEPGSKAPVVVTRTCPACGSNRMRLVRANPSSQYINIEECLYKCDCGEEAEYIVMQEEWRGPLGHRR
jgi:hypothetical protein